MQFQKKIGSLFEINLNWSELAKSFIDPISIMKISVYLLLLMASFIMNYRHNIQEVKDYSKDSEEYNNKVTENEEYNQKVVDKMVNDRENNIHINDMEKVTPEKNQQYTDLYNK